MVLLLLFADWVMRERATVQRQPASGELPISQLV